MSIYEGLQANIDSIVSLQCILSLACFKYLGEPETTLASTIKCFQLFISYITCNMSATWLDCHI